jgi:hypothetical protein
MSFLSPWADAKPRAMPAPAPAPIPVVSGPDGQRAFDVLGNYYRSASDRTPDYESMLRDLNASDPGKASHAGRYILALFKQSLADESNGRVAWVPTPVVGGGMINAGSEFRDALAKPFGETAKSEDALDAALWLIDHDLDPDNEEAGAQVLARLHSPRADAAIQRLIAEVHPNQMVLVTAIIEAGKRHLTGSKKNVVALEQSYRTAVRKAAIAAAALLGETKSTAYDSLKAFTPRVIHALEAAASRVATPIPAKAEWLDGIEQPPGTPRQPFPISGWSLRSDDNGTTILDSFGRVRTLTKKDALFTPGNLARTAEHYAKVRATVAEDERQYEAIERDFNLANKGNTQPDFRALGDKQLPLDDEMYRLMKEMTTYTMYMGPPGRSFLNLPEINVAAWCWERGERARAAQVIFPCYDASRDDRWIDWKARDDQAALYQDEMLDKFSVERDYPAALALARHLCESEFDGYYYEPRARELASQLEARSDDFKSLTLPAPQEWTDLQTKLSRKEQIRYLASRLRLLHCVQPGQPGGVSYDDPQYRDPCKPFTHPKDDPKVINPYVELQKLNLNTDDLLVLAPYAADRDYLLTYSYWRNFAPERTLHRVGWVIGDLVNYVAGITLISQTMDAIHFENDDPANIVEDIETWAKAHPHSYRSDLIAATLETGTYWNTLLQSTRAAAATGERDLLGVIAGRLASIPAQKTSSFEEEEIAAFLYRSGIPLTQDAQQWIKSPCEAVRFWGALALVRDTGSKEALALLPSLFDGHFERYNPAAPVLLARNAPAGAGEIACRIFNPGNFECLRTASFRGNPDLLKRYFLAGRKECLDFLIAQIDRYELDPNVIPQPGHPRYLTDPIVEGIDEWRNYEDRYDDAAQKGEKAAHTFRDDLKRWLVAQFALVQENKKCAIAPLNEGTEYLGLP